MKIDFNPHRDGYKYREVYIYGYDDGEGHGYIGDGSYRFNLMGGSGYYRGAGEEHYNQEHQNHCYSLIWRKIK